MFLPDEGCPDKVFHSLQDEVKSGILEDLSIDLGEALAE